jgi:long-chain acyl-CoA synthetase
MNIQERIRNVLSADPDANAVEFNGTWHRRRDLSDLRHSLDAELSARGLGQGARVGLIARNGPSQVATYIAMLATGRCAVMIHPAQSAERIAAEVRQMNLAALVGEVSDWAEGLVGACRDAGVIGLSVERERIGPATVVGGLHDVPQAGAKQFDAEIALELLSSGTTGAPKRIRIGWPTVEQAVQDAAAVYATGRNDVTPPPGLMFHPLGNIAGFSFITPLFAQGQPLALLEKFALDPWLDLVRRHRPARTSLPPAAIRMIVDRNIPKGDLSCFSVIGTGAAALDPELQEEFESRYGIPLLCAYGATEFGGVVANWTLDMHRQHGAAKRGSVGLPRPGVTFRVIDAQSGAVLPHDSIGVIEAKVDRIGPDWIRTTDLGSMDADGFLYLKGRADGAINRGGFKVIPESVAAVMRQHPKVGDAIIVGVPDPRLGAVPVAVVEPRDGVTDLSADELQAHARQQLVAYQVPVRFLVVDRLPRNASMKVSIPDIMALLAA